MEYIPEKVDGKKQDRWICRTCSAELKRGLPQAVIDWQIESEERAKIQGMRRGGRAKSGKSRKRKVQKNPWYQNQYYS